MQKRNDIELEQEYVSMLYRKLDDLRKLLTERMAAAIPENDETEQRQIQRDITVAMYSDRISRLDGVEYGLCFGRLDFDDEVTKYIGRTGIFDSDRTKDPLLIDWRAAAARPFYQATAARPEGVRRRRHIHTSGRSVTALNDEVLDLSAPRDNWNENVTGEAALMAALVSERTGRMRDIVETIQGEQDTIIRADLDGVLVVQGGPGTGKTAVALHRAAYLLYEYRERLAKRGVLILGPNATFLKYIEDVLPGLAETDVLLRTIGDLYPGVVATRAESDEAARIKGDKNMAEVMLRAVEDRQRVPAKQVTMDTDYGTLTLSPEECADARKIARNSGKLHNLARIVFTREVLDILSSQVAERIGEDPLGGENLLEETDIAQIAEELIKESDVLAVLDWLWPILTPQQLVAGLLSTDKRVAYAAPHLTMEERRTILRPPHSGWSVSEVPLLDEAAELLGTVNNTEDQEKAARRKAERSAYAQGVIDIALGSRSIDVEDEDDPEILLVTDIMDAALLGERHADAGYLTTAQRAAKDRSWTFGHIIVDEAQDISHMAWRMIMRRTVSRSMTIVGDLAQSSMATGTSWNDILWRFIGVDQLSYRELTVSYRTPTEIMALASQILPRIGLDMESPRAVRSSGVEPWTLTVDAGELAKRLRQAVTEEKAAVGAGQVGVIAPQTHIDDVRQALAGLDGFDSSASDLTDSIVAVSVRQTKGLEFDAVIVVDPERIENESVRGASDLYVALTRATRRLGQIHVNNVHDHYG